MGKCYASSDGTHQKYFWNGLQRRLDYHQLRQTNHRAETAAANTHEALQAAAKEDIACDRSSKLSLPSQSCRLCGATEGQMTRLLASKRGFWNLLSSSDLFTQDHRDMVFCGSFSLDLTNPQERVGFHLHAVKTHSVAAEHCRLEGHKLSHTVPAQTAWGNPFNISR